MAEDIIHKEEEYPRQSESTDTPEVPQKEIISTSHASKHRIDAMLWEFNG